MGIRNCVPQKMLQYLFVGFLVAAAVAMTVVSLTILPIVGFAVVIPIVILAVYVFRLRLNNQCDIDVSKDV
jgi:mannose/fructose/N-acetylgalactosamine-specific phosphotransferase system component IIC